MQKLFFFLICLITVGILPCLTICTIAPKCAVLYSRYRKSALSPHVLSQRAPERETGGDTGGRERVEEHKDTERREENFPVQSVSRVLACISVGRSKLAVRKLPEVLRQVQKSAEVIGGRSLVASISHSIAGGKCSLLRRSKVLSPPHYFLGWVASASAGGKESGEVKKQM